MNIMIIGAGFTGVQLAKRLLNEKNTVTIIDNNEETVENVKSQLDCDVFIDNGLHVCRHDRELEGMSSKCNGCVTF